MFGKLRDRRHRRKYEHYKSLGYGTTEFVYDTGIVKFMVLYEGVVELDDEIKELCREIADLEIANSIEKLEAANS